MLLEMSQKPKDFDQHIKRYTASLTTTMVYGWRAVTFDHPDVTAVFEGGNITGKVPKLS